MPPSGFASFRIWLVWLQPPLTGAHPNGRDSICPARGSYPFLVSRSTLPIVPQCVFSFHLSPVIFRLTQPTPPTPPLRQNFRHIFFKRVAGFVQSTRIYQ